MAYTAIDNPELYFQCKLYTGNGIDDTAITLDGDENMQPDLIWIKPRNDARGTHVVDVIRGATINLITNENSAEQTQATAVKSFDSDGFTLGTANDVNKSSNTHVAFCWKESATAGFDIVSYTGNGTDDTDISHNLSAVPKMIIIKNRDAADDWQVYHAGNTSAPETDYLVLNETDATVDAADRWSDEAPTSSVFTLGDADEVNTDTEDYIAYCFAEKQGFSKFGSYTGNGDDDGVFIYTGFKPAFVITRQTNSANYWHIHDNKRNTFNVVNTQLQANDSGVDNTPAGGENSRDFLSNGFKFRDADHNNQAHSYIYIAFAEAPFVNSNGVPCNAR